MVVERLDRFVRARIEELFVTVEMPNGKAFEKD
jgi:hypothetical protein